jgi:hypothetical protein
LRRVHQVDAVDLPASVRLALHDVVGEPGRPVLPDEQHFLHRHAVAAQGKLAELHLPGPVDGGIAGLDHAHEILCAAELALDHGRGERIGEPAVVGSESAQLLLDHAPDCRCVTRILGKRGLREPHCDPQSNSQGNRHREQ